MPPKNRRYVQRNALEDVSIKPGQLVAKVLDIRGGGLFEVGFPPEGTDNADGATAEGAKCLVQLPPKFKNIVWVKRGNFVIVDRSELSAKVEGEIIHVLRPEHIKDLRQSGDWPTAFENKVENTEEIDDLEDSDGSEADDNLLELL
ncbi:putative RNA-binding protein eif1ad [Irineochytrium annulatum]|nr:putative RNA-binding protein eif1ad [Irineochytrium annulatum]